MNRQSVFSVIEAMADGVDAAKPITWPHLGFCVERGSIGEDLESWIRDPSARNTRQAVVRISTLPSVGSSLCYVEFDVVIEVAYKCEIAEDIRNAMFSDDAIALFDKITRNPSRYWGNADSVYPSGSASVEGLYDDSNRPVLFVLSLPFRVIVH